MTTSHDLVIVGGGIAGMTAAIYAARADLDVLLLEREICGGLANSTYSVENFPSYQRINGMDLFSSASNLTPGPSKEKSIWIAAATS